jgi:small-conductance mechanosensitive channel
MDFDALLVEAAAIAERALLAAEALVQPSALLQFALIAGCVLVAYALAGRLRPEIDAWTRRARDPASVQARLGRLLSRRLTPLLIVATALIVLLVMRSITWPSRSYYIGIAVIVAAGWTFVAIASGLIANRLLRQAVAFVAWTAVALAAFGHLQQTIELLDTVAFRFGETRLSLLSIIKAAFTLVIMLGVASWLASLTARRVSTVEDISPSMRVLTTKVVQVALFGAAIIVSLNSVGFDLTSITVLSGAIGLGLGFGLQKVVSNLVSGVILLLDRSIKPGDVISLGETFGWISSLGARYVSVVTRDGKEYLIPNEDLITGQVVNWSHSNDLVRLDILFGVSYASDPHQVRAVARAAAADVGRVAATPAPVCHIVGFGESSIDFILRFWIHDPSNGITNVRGDVYLALWDALKANAIEIPYPRRDVAILRDDA